MKTILLSVILTVVTVYYVSAQVGIGTTTPSSSSMLDVSSTTSGLLVPRMTAAQRALIPSPATGLIIYQTNSSPGLYYNSGTPSAPVWILAGTTTGQWLTNGSSIYYNNGNVGIGTSSPTYPLVVKSPTLSWDMAAFTNASDEIIARIRQASNGSGTIYLYDAAGTNTIFLYGDGNSWIRGGRLAIGHNAPAAGLHLKGSGLPESFMYIEGTTGSDAGLRLYENGTVKWHFYNNVANDGLEIQNSTGYTSLFAKQANGYVGIGTITPATLLDVRGNLSINNSGRIGIGTTNPSAPLHVVGDASIMSGQLGIGTTTPGAGLHVKATGYPNSFLYLESGTSNDAGIRMYEGTTAQWHIFHNSTLNGLQIYNWQSETAIFCENADAYVAIGHTDPERPLDVKGNMVVRNETTNEIVVELGVGLDYAEGFNTAAQEEPEPGTVMSIDPENPGMLMVSKEPSDRKVAGIVAGANNLGSGIVLGSGEHQINVALAGRVYCKVDATERAIEAGDLLTTSAVPGYATRACPGERWDGAILGKAMQSLPKGCKGQILVLVTLQ
jgi:hypothetical protein